MLEKQLDVITASRVMTAGHFTAVKNIEELNRLVLTDPAYRTILMEETFWSYDENSWGTGRPNQNSFTKTVRAAEHEGRITVHWGLPVRGNTPWPGKVVRYDGSSIRTEDETELVYFHWGTAKRNFRTLLRLYSLPDDDQLVYGFNIDSFGIHKTGEGKAGEKARHLLRLLHATQLGQNTGRMIRGVAQKAYKFKRLTRLR